jgi:hypothetical protein
MTRWPTTKTSAGFFHEAVAHLADVDEAVLMHADVHEGSERGGVRDDAGKLLAGLEVFHFLDALGEAERLELKV